VLSRRAVISGLGASLAGSLCRAAPARGSSIIDTHVHPPRGPRGLAEFEPSALLADMDRLGVEQVVLSPPPLPPVVSGPRLAELRASARRSPRFAFAAGGESLNPLLQQTNPERVGGDLLRRFCAIAEEIAAAGAASFGELAAEHFSSGRGRHPYESSPPDHPLLLALADVAARHSLPIDLHMEAVPADMPFPADRPRGPNPAQLRANIGRLERLLEHNREARIVWLHAGWDLTGERTIPLMRGLLERHPNLAMSIKCDHSGARATAPFFPDEPAVRPGWVAMLSAFPDRFLIGSDQFAGEDTERMECARALIEALPPELARRVASENARRIYRLGSL
jgi:predicted TIM-barrel fold metal-dependent hydrolase